MGKTRESKIGNEARSSSLADLGVDLGVGADLGRRGSEGFLNLPWSGKTSLIAASLLLFRMPKMALDFAAENLTANFLKQQC